MHVTVKENTIAFIYMYKSIMFVALKGSPFQLRFNLLMLEASICEFLMFVAPDFFIRVYF